MQNGRLDVATLVDWDGYQNYLDPEAAAQWIGARNAYFDEIGVWLYTSECYRPVGNPGDLDRGTINTQWYWKEWWTRAGKPGNAAQPGTNSTHGWGKGIDLVGWPERAQLVPIMAAYGWLFNVDGEPWHLSYVGNPSITASETPLTAATSRKKLTDMRYNQDSNNTWWLRTANGRIGVPTANADEVVLLDRYVNGTGHQQFHRVELAIIDRLIRSVESDPNAVVVK